MLRRLPSPFAIFAFAVAGVLVGITLTKGLADPDFYWHVATGRLIAETGQIPSVDPFSFTWFGQPWTLHEWLSELGMHWLVEIVGPVGALIVFGLVAGASVMVIGVMVARRGVRLLAFALPAVLAVAVITPYVTARPQIISWLLLALTIWLLDELRPERPGRVLLLIPLFVLWANLHGVYVVGLGVVFTYALFTALGRTPMAPARGWMFGGLAAAFLATTLTPAGPIGILYPLRYIDGGDWGLANIQEWQSPNFHEPAHYALIGLIVALGLNGGRGTPGWLVMLSWVGVVMALFSMRNAPIAAIFALPSLALGLEARLAARDAGRAPRGTPSERIATTRRLMEIGAALVVVVGALIVLVPPILGNGIERGVAAKYPTGAVDLLLDVRPDARVLADYGWGGYIIGRMHESGGRVFVDGRNDMYDDAVLREYDTVRNADPGWEAITERHAVDAILLRPTATVTRGPAEAAGWCEAFRDEVQVLYLRECGEAQGGAG